MSSISRDVGDMRYVSFFLVLSSSSSLPSVISLIWLWYGQNGHFRENLKLLFVSKNLLLKSSNSRGDAEMKYISFSVLFAFQ